jgi:hypothetical protein
MLEMMNKSYVEEMYLFAHRLQCIATPMWTILMITFV